MRVKSGHKYKDPVQRNRGPHSNRGRSPKALARPNKRKAKAAKANAVNAGTGAVGVVAVVVTVLPPVAQQVLHQHPHRREVDRCMALLDAACGRVQR